ncbi:MAG: argininosuccinate synthase-related protein [Colwellia sp.]
MKLIRSTKDLEFVSETGGHILTLFSGGLDSTYLFKIIQKYKCKITALTVDLGDGVNGSDLKEITQFFGVDLIVVDAREMFANEFVIPAIRSQAKYMGIYPISSSLSRPIISKIAVQKAKELGCNAIVHTANQSQNSLRRLNGAIKQLGYDGFYGSPYEYTAISRDQKINELATIGISKHSARGVSGDGNLWCREFESGTLDNPENFHAQESLFDWSIIDSELKTNKAEISITFTQGVPTHVDSLKMDILTLIEYVNKKVGAFGVGRFSGLEHLAQGEKVLEVREAPAAMILMESYRHLESAVYDADHIKEKVSLEQCWVKEAIEGRWFCDLKGAIDSFILFSSKKICGTVTHTLRQGATDLISIKASNPLYLTDRDQWEIETARVSSSRNLYESNSFNVTCTNKQLSIIAA